MKGCRILIVEDELIVSKEIAQRLGAMGYRVVGSARNSAQALKLAGELHPDLVLVDIHLQGTMDGIATAAEIRRHYSLPVLFLTACSEDSTMDKAKPAEPYGYILKPFVERELRSAIEIAIHEHSTDREIQRLNRLYAVLSHVNQAVIRTTSWGELLQTVCRLLVEQGAINMAWIGRLDLATGRIHPVAAFGDSIEILNMEDSSGDDLPEGPGNPARAIREEEPTICNTCKDSTCPLLIGHGPVPLGFNSCGSFPIRFQGHAWGVLNLGVAEAGFFQKQEIELLKEVTSDISFALEKLEGDAMRRQAQEALRVSEEKYRTLVESSPQAFFVQTRQRFAYLNPEAVRLFGAVSAEELLGTPILERVHPDFRLQVGERIRSVNREKRNVPIWTGKYMKVDGSVVDVEVSSVPFQYEEEDGSLVFVRDITERKRTQDQLEEKSRHLTEVNAALRSLLRQREEDRKEFEDTVVCNLKHLVKPYLENLKKSQLNADQSTWLEIVETQLDQVTSRFARNLTLQQLNLSNAELRVAALVRDGKTTKEIAEILLTSEKTISFHRDNIRAKLGLRGRKGGLRSLLLSLT